MEDKGEKKVGFKWMKTKLCCKSGVREENIENWQLADL